MTTAGLFAVARVEREGNHTDPRLKRNQIKSQTCLSQLAECFGWQPQHRLKDTGKVGGIRKTHLFGHLLDHGPGFSQLFSGMVHFQTHEVLVRALVVVTLEQAAEVNPVNMALPGNLRQGFEFQKYV